MKANAVAVYLRVSTDDQSHESQRLEVDRWLAREGFDSAKVRWYVDVETGRTLHRVELRRLRADLAEGRVRAVVVYKLDRISRNMLDGMALLTEWLEAGVRVASVTEPIELSGAVGKIVAAVLLGFAEIEWSARRERQRAGIEVAKSKGAYKGRQPGTLKASPSRAAELRAQGLTLPEVARALGVSRATAARYLASAPP